MDARDGLRKLERFEFSTTKNLTMMDFVERHMSTVIADKPS